ncbi:hypothetical protein AB0L50_25710 [Streptomyces flaveolus]|uniref:hypothetical protein n=1 Tax=Streptomyces flaveolus TaxID=67297 RepID=UPI0034291ACE
MAKRTWRAARTTAPRKNRTRTHHTTTNSPQSPRARSPWWPANRPSKRRDASQRRTLPRYLLRGAAYSTGSSIVGFLFWLLRLWMT